MIMPFKPQDKLDDKPSIRIFFIGLNILQLTDNDSSIQAFVHNSSQQHQLTIETRRKRKDAPDQLMMRHVGPLSLTSHDSDPAHPHSFGLMIQTFGLPTGAKGVTAYTQVVASSEGTKLSDSFSLTKLLGNKSPGTVEHAGGTPSILIDHGEFYTAAKVTTHAKIVKNIGGAATDLTEVPTIIGANIKLDPADPAQNTTLFWRQEGTEVFLPLQGSNDFTYEIYVINEPLFEPDDPNVERHGEFTEYFKILPDVAEGDKFEIKFVQVIPDRGSTRAPCMSVLYDPAP
jgi:hypothetical protein